MNGETEKFGNLRLMIDGDVKMVLEWRNAPVIRKNMYTQKVIYIKDHRAWWAEAKDRENAKYLIFEADGAPRGVVNFTKIEAKHRTAEWGFYTSPSAPPGTGSRMGFCALDYAFDVLNLYKLRGEVLSFNSDSLEFHKKLGFSSLGLVKAHKKIDGAYVDVYRLAIFAADWSRKRTELLVKLSRRL